ncbi:retrovirus-related pol polyprotein from transposon opus [Tanacetum coccineum]
MEDPNITMEEYIRLEEEKARRHAIVFNDTLTSQVAISCEPTVSSLNDKKIDFRISFDESDDEDYTVIYDKNSFSYKIICVDNLKTDSENDNDKVNMPSFPSPEPMVNIADFEERLEKIYGREMHQVQVFNFRGLIDLMADGFSGRMLMEHREAQGQSMFTSRAWRRLFEVRGPLVHELILEFFSTFKFGEAILDLDTTGALQFQLGGARRHMSWREFILGMGLHTAEEIESARFGTYWAESARQIPDKGAPEKVTVTDLFYLRGMDVGSVNIPYLLARLKGLAVIVQDLLVIDMAKLVRLQICEELDDTWAWVSPGLERQPNAATGSPDVAEGALYITEGGQAVPAPVQAPQPPPVAGPARSLPQRVARLEEGVYGMREALGEQREQKLKTQDRMRQWDVGLSIDLNLLRCPLCDLVPDSHDHLFFECSFSTQVWFKVCALCVMDSISPQLVDVMAFIVPISKGKTVISILSRIVVAASLYSIWLERNGRLFKKKTSSLDQIIQVILSMVRLKLVTFKFKKMSTRSRLLTYGRFQAIVLLMMGGPSEGCTLFSLSKVFPTGFSLERFFKEADSPGSYLLLLCSYWFAGCSLDFMFSSWFMSNLVWPFC